MENDVYRHPGDRCLFPPRVNASYKNVASSEKSIAYLQKYLERHPDALDVKWLLNLAYMTVGKYPAGVPQQYLIAPSVFDSPEDVGRFVDVAPEAGINLYSMSGGLIVDDFDNDGLLDIVTSGLRSVRCHAFFPQQRRRHVYAIAPQQAGLAEQLGGLNILQTDYNNDGCLDILVLRGGWEFPQRKSLLRNNCDGTFTDVTADAGLAKRDHETQTAVWADIDNDGFLDLFVGNENGPSPAVPQQGRRHLRGHRAAPRVSTARLHQGSGRRRLRQRRLCRPVCLKSGWQTISTTTITMERSPTWREGGRAEVRAKVRGLVLRLTTTMACRTFLSPVLRRIRRGRDEGYLGLPPNAETSSCTEPGQRHVPRRHGGGRAQRVFMPMGANFGDIDNDGFLDIYLGTGIRRTPRWCRMSCCITRKVSSSPM